MIRISKLRPPVCGDGRLIETGRNAHEVQSLMLAKGVAIGRPFPLLDKMIRVSIGTDGEMERFRHTLVELLAA